MDSILDAIVGRTLEFVQTAIVVTEAKGFDRPIVYTNPAFETLTGYSEDEVLGRDCRFLQNDDRDQIELKEIRNSLLDQRPAKAIIRNYRKDGSQFFNELRINPILNEKREVTHFIGSQNAVAYPAIARLQPDASALIGNLSTQEKKVFEWVVRGCSSKEIALVMDLSPRTVEKYRHRMQRKMGTNSLAMLVRYAIAFGTEIYDPKSG